jgi:hypothetical protein
LVLQSFVKDYRSMRERKMYEAIVALAEEAGLSEHAASRKPGSKLNLEREAAQLVTRAAKSATHRKAKVQAGAPSSW